MEYLKAMHLRGMRKKSTQCGARIAVVAMLIAQLLISLHVACEDHGEHNAAAECVTCTLRAHLDHGAPAPETGIDLPVSSGVSVAYRPLETVVARPTAAPGVPRAPPLSA